jgi:hypothetical protein
MRRQTLDPFQFLAGVLAGWANQQQQHALEYLREENRVLREQLAGSVFAIPMTSAADWPRRLRR